MTRNKFKKCDKENKIALLSGVLNEMWYDIIPLMTKVENGKCNEDEMTEIYTLFNDLKEKIERYK